MEQKKQPIFDSRNPLDTHFIESISFYEGDNLMICQVGSNCVEHIDEYRPQGEGDKWYYDVYYTSGRVDRFFNIDSVTFKPIDL